MSGRFGKSSSKGYPSSFRSGTAYYSFRNEQKLDGRYIVTLSLYSYLLSRSSLTYCLSFAKSLSRIYLNFLRLEISFSVVSYACGTIDGFLKY